MAERRCLNFCCGAVEVRVSGGFDGHELDGYGLGIATFNQNQRERYFQLQNRYKILAQSQPVLNPNSGNWIFAVVFTKKDKVVLNATRR